MKIEQKIVTGGTSSTSTPIFRFLTNTELFEPASEARHIAHWARAGSAIARTPIVATKIDRAKNHLRMMLLSGGQAAASFQ